MDLEELNFLLKKYSLAPNKLRGQNFLISDEVLGDIIKVSQVSKKDLILEVGPGPGALTASLMKQAGQVVSFEIDDNFRELLNKLEKVNSNLKVVWHDILSLTDAQWQNLLKQYKFKEYKIVANIPYYLTAKFIRKFILAQVKPSSMTLMVQKEVAQRIGDSKESMLSLSVKLYAKSKLSKVVTKDNFYPQPKVDSAILHIYDIHDWQYPADEKRVWQLIHRGFAQKRKKLFNNLLSDQKISKEKLEQIFKELKLDTNIRA
ncbi:16S rRNA (adenine(1518)-N(6)/adenine(1519)-N(6))-dimethyltransferase RsmA, partial [bacterium]|nr:16S rRNA (adenine(1518)-N(6)/adenine(1519)-N(6))-dimethyltransferase RsmA [bacterium]